MANLELTPSVRTLRANLSTYVTAAEDDGSVVTITRDGKAVAAIVPLFMLERLEQWEDEELSRRADEALAEYDGDGVSLTELTAEVLDEPRAHHGAP